MAAGLADFHCHLDLYPDHAAAVAECERCGIFALAVTTTPRAWPRNRDLSVATRHVRAALGLHPQLVAERADEISIWEMHLSETRYVGEVGLDASPTHRSSFEMQRRVFERVLMACAEEGGKILTIHAVRSAGIVLDMIETHLPPARGRVVLHWFSGSGRDGRRAAELGCYFSINSQMLIGERQRALVASLPQDRLLTETDGPFVQIEGRAARPLDVAEILHMMARVRNVDASAMRATVWANFQRLLSSSVIPSGFD